MVKICLNMIVKNESKIITRLFDTLNGIIDCWIISDTGSSDGTQEIIHNYFKNKNIPGELHYHEWKNFGHNRSLALKCAQETPIEFDYILLLDADMKLVITPAFDKSKLDKDVYTVKQGNVGFSYYNTRLIRKTAIATCVSVTHEYYDIKGISGPTGIQADASIAPLDTIYIDDIGDGGSKNDKFERDIKLLLQGLIDEPENPRYFFYLAQSYFCINDMPNAIIYYLKCIAGKG